MPIWGALFLIKHDSLRRGVFVVLIVLTSILSEALSRTTFPTTLLSFMHLFLTGMLVADITLTKTMSKLDRPQLWDVVGLLSFVGFVVFMKLFEASKISYMAPLFFLMVLSACHGFRLKAILSNSWIYKIGGMCYSIYLFHTVILRFFFEMTPIGELLASSYSPIVASILILALGTSFVFAIGAIIFSIFERPFMDSNWIHKLQKARR